ncbi:MAG: ornithine carbamoyltransferase [Patescibacteria group bacterium]
MDYLKDNDFLAKQIAEVLDLSANIKARPMDFGSALKGRTVALLFEKASLRTKFTLQIGIGQMGGYSVLNDGKIPDREPIADIARNLERWVDIVVARVYAHSTLEELAKFCRVPVVNALSDWYHPCQVLADMLTLKEKYGDLRKVKLAFIGDGNNVCNSLMLASSSLGLDFRVATPKNYGPQKQVVKAAQGLGAKSKARIFITNNIDKAVMGADAIYTDTWVSMGLEAETDIRRRDFKGYQVNEKIFKSAAKHAVFMHCLPKHPNEEVSDEVFESNRSLVFEQAENRLHTIKALLLFLLNN